MKYVWLNINTGEFSNSWSQETHDKYCKFIESDQWFKENGFKLIKYECVSNPEFDFYDKMKIVTNVQK